MEKRYRRGGPVRQFKRAWTELLEAERAYDANMQRIRDEDLAQSAFYIGDDDLHAAPQDLEALAAVLATGPRVESLDHLLDAPSDTSGGGTDR